MLFIFLWKKCFQYHKTVCKTAKLSVQIKDQEIVENATIGGYKLLPIYVM